MGIGTKLLPCVLVPYIRRFLVTGTGMEEKSMTWIYSTGKKIRFRTTGANDMVSYHRKIMVLPNFIDFS